MMISFLNPLYFLSTFQHYCHHQVNPSSSRLSQRGPPASATGHLLSYQSPPFTVRHLPSHFIICHASMSFKFLSMRGINNILVWHMWLSRCASRCGSPARRNQPPVLPGQWGGGAGAGGGLHLHELQTAGHDRCRGHGTTSGGEWVDCFEQHPRD